MESVALPHAGGLPAYGHHIDGKYKVLAAVLGGILIFEALR